MNYTQVYRRYELKPVNPELNFSPGQVRSGRKAFPVQKNMQSSGLGPGGDYYLQRYQHMLDDGTGQSVQPKSQLGTYSSPQFRKKAEELDPRQPSNSYEGSPPGDFSFPHGGTEPVSMAQSPAPAYEPQYDQRSPPQQSYEQRRQDPPQQSYEQRRQDPPQPSSYDAARVPGYDSQYEAQPQASPDPPKPRYDPSPPYNPPDPDKPSELERLQDQLRQREEELNRFKRDQRARQVASQSPPKIRAKTEDVETFDRISKSLWDKQVFSENRKQTVQALEYQLSEKQMKAQWETLQREKEQMQRLEHLKRLREVEMQERLNQMTRAQKYREHLDMQRQLKYELNIQEKLKNSAAPPQETAPPMRQTDMRNSYEPKTEFEKVAMEFYEQNGDVPNATSLTPFRLTKKSPKTVTYNPITGIVRDTSIYLQSNIARPVLKSYLPEPKNQDKVVPEYARLPAFQQPSYTAKNPKLIVTDPITMKLPKKDFMTQEFFEDAAKFFGVDSEDPSDPRRPPNHLAEVGSMIVHSPSPPYARDPVISKASGYNYKDTRYLFQ